MSVTQQNKDTNLKTITLCYFIPFTIFHPICIENTLFPLNLLFLFQYKDNFYWWSTLSRWTVNWFKTWFKRYWYKWINYWFKSIQLAFLCASSNSFRNTRIKGFISKFWIIFYHYWSEIVCVCVCAGGEGGKTKDRKSAYWKK